MFFHDGNRGGAEISGARIIAKALPGVQHLMFGSDGESGEIGESLHPFIIIRDDGGDLGLLEHEL